MHEDYLRQAIEHARSGVARDIGGPFGAVIVRDGEILGWGENRVISTNDPTAHAEVVAIRDACQHVGEYHLPGAILYASCEPCPMCLAAIYWARIERVYFGASCQDAADLGFADDFVRRELPLANHERSIVSEQLLRDEALAPFRAWREKHDKRWY